MSLDRLGVFQDESLVMVAIVVTVAILCVHLCMLVTRDLDQVVPVHDGPHLVLQSVLLLNLLTRGCYHTLVLDFLTSALGAVIKQRETRLLRLVLANLILLDRSLLFLADPAHVQLFRFDLATLFDLLLVGQN